MSKRTMNFIFIAFLAVGFSGQFIDGIKLWSIRVNYTQSLSQTLFVSHPFDVQRMSLLKDEFVCFSHPGCSKKLVKRIAGVEGDLIRVKNRQVFVGSTDCGIALERGSKTNVFLDVIEEGIIPPGYVYVTADSHDSFDSRYRVFGLVEVSKIEEKLWPVY